MSGRRAPVEVFLCYAPEDELLCLELEKHLSLLKREELLTVWHKRRLLAGADLSQTLDEHLCQASVILLLLSADFIASDYCYGTEMQRAMRRHEAGEAWVMPIVLRPIDDWAGLPIGQLRALPSDGTPVTSWRDPHAAFADVAKGIRMILQEGRPSGARMTVATSTPSVTTTVDASWKGWLIWLVFVFLVVLAPLAACVVAAKMLSLHPMLMALIVLGYEGLLFVLSLARKMWQRVEGSLVESIMGWLTLGVQEMTAHYSERYCQYLVYEHQVFDVKGLSTRSAHDLELEQVFVQLRVNTLPAHQASGNPFARATLLQGTHTIWDYLVAPVLSNHHLVILGAPGSGKTTLLKHLALRLAEPKKSPHRAGVHVFPILLFLRDYVRLIADHPDFSLAHAVEEHIERTWQQSIPAAWISRHLERGHCLVLLDGLDEVASGPTRKLVVAWVQRQLIAYGRNRFVLSSRPYGYRENPLQGVTVLDVQAFTPGQVEQFVRNWYLANELKSWGKDDPGVRLRASLGARDLLQRLHLAPALLVLAVNPLLLTMIATVHRYRSSLPGKRVDLYAEICEVFLGKRHEVLGIAQELSPAQKQHVLQSLAYDLMQRGSREISCEQAQEVITPA